MMIQLKGRITEQGELRVKLPAGLPAGEVDVFVLPLAEAVPAEDVTWTEEELAELLSPQPPAKSGAEIVAWLEGGGGWENMGITDSAEWVAEQRLRVQC